MIQNFFIILFFAILVASMVAMVLRDIFGPLKPNNAMEDVAKNHTSYWTMQEIEPIASSANTISAHIERMRQGLPEPLEPDFGN